MVTYFLNIISFFEGKKSYNLPEKVYGRADLHVCFIASSKRINIKGLINLSIMGLLIVISLLQGSCSNPEEPIKNNNNTVDTVASNGILPLKAGYYWKYQNYNLKEDSSIAGEEGDYENRISSSSTITIGMNDYIVFHQLYGYFDPRLMTIYLEMMSGTIIYN